MGHRRFVLTPEAEDFLREWRSSVPYVTAHTSGSTGRPKEIRLLKDDMRASARATAEFFGLTSSSTLALPLSPSYIAGKMQIVRALETGCTLVSERPSSSPLAGWDEGRVTLLPLVPSQIEGFVSSPAFRLTDNLIVGGAPLSAKVENRLVSAGLRAYSTYGMTETCSHVALRRLGEEWFRGLPGFEFSLDARGCLVIVSSTLSFGRLVTNDMVSLLSPDRFRWLGRYDNVINSGGVKVHPEEVESVMAPLLPAGVTAYVTSRRSDRLGEEVVIVTDSPSLDGNLLERLRDLLPPYHAPRAVIRLPSIPLTPVSGKIVRQKF